MEEKQIGNEPEIQTFYEGPEKIKDVINWVEKIPTQMPENVQERYSNVAIRVYKRKDRDDKRKNYGGLTALKFHCVEIQSPIIIAAIEPILAGNGMVIPDNNLIAFHPPFQELYFAHTKIFDLAKRSEVEERQHLDLLIRIMEELFEEIMPRVAQLHATKRITFSLIWTILPKDILLYSHVDGQDRIYQLNKATLTTDSVYPLWHLQVRYIQFNGTRFGWATTYMTIPKFRGAKPISTLSIYPVGYHSDRSLEKRLLERGKKVLDFQDVRYRGYNGIALDTSGEEDDEVQDKDTVGYPYVRTTKSCTSNSG